MYTYLSIYVYIIRYTNNTYVLFRMLQVSLQHCCWAPYQFAEQVTIINLVALRGSWGIVLDNDLESNRRSGPGEGTHFMNTTYAPPFYPPFFRSVESLFSFDPDTCFDPLIVRRAGLLLSQQDFEWRWSVPLFQCLTVLEFSFILFDLCLLITFFNFIMNYVPIVTFWIFTYHKIWILSIMFCFIWSYWIIYFLACL